MQQGCDDQEAELERFREEMVDRVQRANENACDDDDVQRRGIGGVDRRGNLDTNAIDDEINKDSGTRKLVKVADYPYQIRNINKFSSSFSPYKIFMEFIKLF